MFRVEGETNNLRIWPGHSQAAAGAAVYVRLCKEDTTQSPLTLLEEAGFGVST
jgi:hypothetical protein